MTASAPPRILGEKHVEALTVAMIVAPGVYVRNRMYELFNAPGARRARVRAGIVRGLVAHLARASAVTLESESRAGETVFVLRYAIPAVRLTRVVELSPAELAALRTIAERAKVHCLPRGADDDVLVARALSRLLEPDVEPEVASLARSIAPPPPGE